MRKAHLILYMFVALTFKAFTQPLAPANKHWETIEELSDEFNGSSLDVTKWRDYHPYWSGRGSTFRKYNVWVEGGSLRLKSTKNENNSIDAACVSSQSPSMKVGYYSEARIWCPSMSMTGAYWFQSKSQAEIDVIENFGNASNHSEDRYRMLTNTHYFANGWNNDEKTPWYGGSDILKPYACDETFYVYGVWWKNENEIIFYCDGKEVHKVTTKSKFTKSMYMFFDMEVFGWWGSPKDADIADPSKNTQYVDWVRTFKLADGNSGNPGGNGISSGGPNTNHPVDPRVNQVIVDVSGIQMSQASLSMYNNQRKALSYNVLPSMASDKSVSWSSADTSIAKVNTSGIITGIGIGSTKIEVKTNDGGFSDFCNVTVSLLVQSAFPNGLAHAIPGTIESEDFDNGGEGLAFHDTDNNLSKVYRIGEGVDIEACSEGGYNIGWISPGEWIEYTVDVKEDGLYDMAIRYAALETGGPIHIEFDETNLVNKVTFPTTGDWQKYNTLTKQVELKKGIQTMRIVFDKNGMNLNKVTFATSKSNVALYESFDSKDFVTIYPNPSKGNNVVVKMNGSKSGFDVRIIDFHGKLISYQKTNQNILEISNDVFATKCLYLFQVNDENNTFFKKVLID